MRAVLFAVALVACSVTIAPGDEGGPCLADGGCNGGLTCVVNQCVEGPPGDDAGADVAQDVAVVVDASDDAE